MSALILKTLKTLKILKSLKAQSALGLLCLVTIILQDLAAQPRILVDPHSAASSPSISILLSPEEDYRLAPGDTIDILIEDAPELSHTFRLTAEGDFEMPLLGIINARGKKVDDVGKMIIAGLRRERYLKQPFVKVIIKQYSSHYYFIQGAVRQAGVYQTEGQPSLVKLIGLAGGLNENHGPTAIILRPIKRKQMIEPQLPALETGAGAATEQSTVDASEKGHEQYVLIKVNLNAMYLQGHFEQNFTIAPGDIVNIPPANVFFVAGEVHAPGSFQMKEGTTLRQAISLAQGTTFKAKLSEGIIFRDDPETGSRQEIPVKIGSIMNGKSDDLLIYPNDVIIVSNSRLKSVSSALLTALGVNSARLPMRY